MSLVTENILEKVNSLIVIINSSGKVEYVSPSAKRILGFDPEKLMGDGWYNLTRDNSRDRKQIKKIVSDLLQREVLSDTVPQERIIKTADGEDRWILWNFSKGLFNSLVAIGQDISIRKRAEAVLKVDHEQLKQQNKEIWDSLRYASRIQQAILPIPADLDASFSESFVLYLPKDVVSGDYYYFYRFENKVIVVAVDCTGHGVPGALMSVIANSLLKEVILNKKISEPSQMLYALEEELRLALNFEQGNSEACDGMDVAVGLFDFDKNSISYSGAFRPILLVREGEVIEFDANRFPIGFYGDAKKMFVTTTRELKTGDCFYFYTDGYNDQFGGEKGKKFTRRRFKELILSMQSMTMREQKSFLKYALKNWKQEEPQTDDILVIGLRI
jgi:PAS domain S-box-containing protein